MNLPFHIARRYFFSRRSGGSFNLITIISGISLLGYAVGTAALIVVLSVFNGFEQLFVGMYTNFDADIRISSATGKAFDESSMNWKALSETEGIWKMSKVLEERAILSYEGRQNIAKVKGVDDAYLKVTSLDSAIVSGFLLLEDGDTNLAVIGQGVAYQLSVDPSDYFKHLVVTVPNREADDALDMTSALSRATILPVGVFSVQEEVDNQYLIVPIRFLRKLLNKPQAVSAIDIRLVNSEKMDDVRDVLREKLGPDYTVSNRFEQREAFFRIMKSEKLVSYFILLFILLVASSNAIGSLYILVIEKKRDLRVMASLGMSEKDASAIFKFESMLIAATGAAAGLVLGIGLCVLQQQYGFVRLDGTANFAFSSYPVELSFPDVMLVLGTVLLLGWVTSLYPARKARQLLAG